MFLIYPRTKLFQLYLAPSKACIYNRWKLSVKPTNSLRKSACKYWTHALRRNAGTSIFTENAMSNCIIQDKWCQPKKAYITQCFRITLPYAYGKMSTTRKQY